MPPWPHSATPWSASRGDSSSTSRPPWSPGSRKRSLGPARAGRLGTRKAAPRHGRRRLVELDRPARLDRLQIGLLAGDVLVTLIRRLSLHRCDSLRRQLVGVLVLDSLQPLGAFG